MQCDPTLERYRCASHLTPPPPLLLLHLPLLVSCTFMTFLLLGRSAAAAVAPTDCVETVESLGPFQIASSSASFLPLPLPYHRHFWPMPRFVNETICPFQSQRWRRQHRARLHLSAFAVLRNVSSQSFCSHFRQSHLFNSINASISARRPLCLPPIHSDPKYRKGR